MQFLGFILLIVILIVLLVLTIKKPKDYKIKIYINNKIIHNIYKANIKEQIKPIIFLEYIDKHDNIIKIDISESIILVSSDPIIAKVLTNAKQIKIGTIADNCKITIKHKNPKFWKYLKLYGKFVIDVQPGPPNRVEIIIKK